jgi:hypothetical protein
MKACKSCSVIKGSEEFYPHPTTRDRLSGICKDCRRDQVKARRKMNPAVQAYDRERAKLPHNRARRRAVMIKWRADHPEAYKAQTAVGNAIRDGKLTKGEKCEVEGCERTDVHAHHEDYAKPLEVNWLCPLHHHRHHAEEGPAHEIPKGNAAKPVGPTPALKGEAHGQIE